MAAATSNARYDTITVVLHWLTAFLVLALFGSAMAWSYLPREMGLHWLAGLHVSFGVALAAVVGARLIWRLTLGRRLEDNPGKPAIRIAARMMHLALYGLLLVQIALGFGIEWFGGSAISVFGVFEIPSPFAASRVVSGRIENAHGVIAWTMMTLVGGHAIAALWHHYAAKDGVLARMLPLRARPVVTDTGAPAE